MGSASGISGASHTARVHLLSRQQVIERAQTIPVVVLRDVIAGEETLNPKFGVLRCGGVEFRIAPVRIVTWDDAKAFCAWEGKRLPTEAEWKRAARGTAEGKIYPWGDRDPTPKSS